MLSNFGLVYVVSSKLWLSAERVPDLSSSTLEQIFFSLFFEFKQEDLTGGFDTRAEYSQNLKLDKLKIPIMMLNSRNLASQTKF